MTTATPAWGVAGSARPGIGRGVAFEDREERLELGAQILHGLGGEGAPRFRLQFARAAVFLDLLPRAPHRVLLGIEPVLDPHHQLALPPLVDAPAAAAL